MARIITFTTDFGVAEHYVGAMKGVICGINSSVQLVDITNSVPSYDLLDGAIAVSQAYSYFPADTVHLVIVDPGVGSARRPIVAKAGIHIFVAPDNGVLSMVYAREETISVRHITAEHYFRQPVSNTFHGRDIFAAVAGYISKGVELDKFGDEITDYVRFAAPKPKPVGPTTWKGMVLKIDKFGNVITNFTPNDVPQVFQTPSPAFKITLGKSEINKFHATYADGAQGELFALLGSTGFLEISMNRGSAARASGAEKGTEISITYS